MSDCTTLQAARLPDSTPVVGCCRSRGNALDPLDAGQSRARRRELIGVSLALPVLIACWDLAGRLDESADRGGASRPEVIATVTGRQIVGIGSR